MSSTHPNSVRGGALSHTWPCQFVSGQNCGVIILCVPSPVTPVKVQVGAAGANSAFVAAFAAIAIGFDAWVFDTATTSGVPGFVRVSLLLLSAIVLGGVVSLGVLLARNPRTIGGSILVDATSVVMPARRFGAIPTSDVAGVGLVRLRNSRSGAAAGSWAVAVWRSDRSLAYAGAFQRSAQVADPASSRAAAAALQLHDAIAGFQGANGLLIREEMQRHASFGPYEPFTGTWDPIPPGAQ